MNTSKTPKWLYRLEAVDPNNGLWYNTNNQLIWGIGKLAECKTKYLPMDYDERYHVDGKNWFSSCSKKEDLSLRCKEKNLDRDKLQELIDDINFALKNF